jgi:dihydrofolate reductase
MHHSMLEMQKSDLLKVGCSSSSWGVVSIQYFAFGVSYTPNQVVQNRLEKSEFSTTKKGVWMMRKVVAGLFITLDGITEAPNLWQETFDEDMGAALGASLPTVDAILMGRVTYQEWASYWPNYQDDAPDGGFAQFVNNLPKYVVSTTLNHVAWGHFDNATLLSGDLVSEIGKLKDQAGKNIAVQGSPGLINSLIQHDLLDELTLYIHNVVAYSGKPLFSQGTLKRLNLLESKATRSGIIIATYQIRKSG